MPTKTSTSAPAPEWDAVRGGTVSSEAGGPWVSWLEGFMEETALEVHPAVRAGRGQGTGEERTSRGPEP